MIKQFIKNRFNKIRKVCPAESFISAKENTAFKIINGERKITEKRNLEMLYGGNALPKIISIKSAYYLLGRAYIFK